MNDIKQKLFEQLSNEISAELDRELLDALRYPLRGKVPRIEGVTDYDINRFRRDIRSVSNGKDFSCEIEQQQNTESRGCDVPELLLRKSERNIDSSTDAIPDNLRIKFDTKQINATTRTLAASFTLEAMEDIIGLHHGPGYKIPIVEGVLSVTR